MLLRPWWIGNKVHKFCILLHPILRLSRSSQGLDYTHFKVILNYFSSTSVFENVSIGVDLLHVSASDRDVDENGRLRFTILSGDARGDFAIGETSGILRVNKQLDYERRNSYELTLQVSLFLNNKV